MAASKIIYPENIAKFKCIGGSCEDNCCRAGSWNIDVDDDTYKKYEAVSGGFGQKLLENIREVEGKKSFKPQTDGRCPFQRPDTLCEIVIQLGEDYLCETCKIYPRQMINFNGNREFGLSLSCPVAVRLLLFDRNGITFAEKPNNSNSIEANETEAVAFRIRALLFGIISYKKFTLMDKIAYMGVFFKGLDKLPVDEALSLYHKNLYTQGILDEVHNARAKTDEFERRKVLLELALVVSNVIKTPEVLPVNTLNTKLYERLNNFKEALKTAEQAMPLSEAYDRVIVPYINKNAYLFENYLFYQIYFTQYPNGITEYGIGYKEFIGEFLMLLMFGAGLYRNKKSIRDWEMVNVIYLFHRTVSHNKAVRKHLTEVLNNIGSMGEFLSLFGKVK